MYECICKISVTTQMYVHYKCIVYLFAIYLLFIHTHIHIIILKRKTGRYYIPYFVLSIFFLILHVKFHKYYPLSLSSSYIGKISSMKKCFYDGRFVEDYLLHKTFKIFHRLDVIGLTVNPENIAGYRWSYYC